jgi:hypothetical protein
MSFLEEFTDTTRNPGQLVRIGTDPRSTEPVMASIRCIPFHEHERIEREHKIQPGTDFAALPKVTRDNVLIAKAKLALADAGPGFNVLVGDPQKVAQLQPLLPGVSVAEGVEIALQGHCTDELKDWLFRSSSKGMFLVQKILEAEGNLRKESLRSEEAQAKN